MGRFMEPPPRAKDWTPSWTAPRWCASAKGDPDEADRVQAGRQVFVRAYPFLVMILPFASPIGRALRRSFDLLLASYRRPMTWIWPRRAGECRYGKLPRREAGDGSTSR